MMQAFSLGATKSTPRIHFDAGKNTLEIKGESYPENTSEFYDPLFEWLEQHLADVHEDCFTIDIELIYFNSSSSKILMNLFDRLEEAAEGGKAIAVRWIYDKKNESSLDYGAEFKEDLTTLEFKLVEKD